ncbi:MAG: hypothetical protein ACI917_001827, partial [Patiriisocius sp.]
PQGKPDLLKSMNKIVGIASKSTLTILCNNQALLH